MIMLPHMSPTDGYFISSLLTWHFNWQPSGVSMVKGGTCTPMTSVVGDPTRAPAELKLGADPVWKQGP